MELAEIAELQRERADADHWRDGLTAAAGPPLVPPRPWFDKEEPDEGPVAWTVTADGQVFGHAAVWGTCHTGKPGKCITPPKSRSDYAYYKTGLTEVDDGELIPTGRITLGTGHASLTASPAATAEHYDNTGAVVADVTVRDGKHGIWVTGALRPGVTPERARELRGASLSGDWRSIRGGLEMLGLLAVNVPGFPVPRAMAASGAEDEVLALVAAGIFADDVQLLPETEDHELEAEFKALYAAAMKRSDAFMTKKQKVKDALCATAAADGKPIVVEVPEEFLDKIRLVSAAEEDDEKDEDDDEPEVREDEEVVEETEDEPDAEGGEEEAEEDEEEEDEEITAAADCEECEPEPVEEFPGELILAASFTQGMRERLADKGEAMSDGSFPIRNRGDLRNAVRAVGRARDEDAAKRWIIKRARELKAVGDLPASWNITASGEEELTAAGAHHLRSSRSTGIGNQPAFVEAQHPRHPKGRSDGGQFAPKGTSKLAPRPDEAGAAAENRRTMGGKLVRGPNGKLMSRTEAGELLDKAEGGRPSMTTDARVPAPGGISYGEPFKAQDGSETVTVYDDGDVIGVVQSKPDGTHIAAQHGRRRGASLTLKNMGEFSSRDAAADALKFLADQTAANKRKKAKRRSVKGDDLYFELTR